VSRTLPRPASGAYLLRAARVYPVDAPVIVDGGVIVADDGRIDWVGRLRDLPDPPPPLLPTEADTVLVPGFVNAHNHLHHTRLAGRIPVQEGSRALDEISRAKRETSPEELVESVVAGARQCLSAGMTTVATNLPAAHPELLHAAASVGLRVVGLVTAKPRRGWRYAAEVVERLEGKVDGTRTFTGLFVHSVVGFSEEELASLGEFANARGLRLSIHMLEFEPEARFFALGEDGDDPIRVALKATYPDRRPPSALYPALPFLGPRTVLVHCCHAGPEDLKLIARHGARVCVCPVSTGLLGNPLARVGQLKALGVNVCLGTDSAATCLRYDFLAEMRSLAASASAQGLGIQELLEMATLSGARALGLDAMIGSLKPGKRADMLVLKPRSLDALEALLEAEIQSVIVDGAVVEPG